MRVFGPNRNKLVDFAGNHLVRGFQSGLYCDIPSISGERIRKDADGVQCVESSKQRPPVIAERCLIFGAGYYLTRHADSPGTPERPLSELGAIGYESFWIKNVLRTLLIMLVESVERQARPECEAWVKTSKEVLKNKLASGGFLTYQGELLWLCSPPRCTKISKPPIISCHRFQSHRFHIRADRTRGMSSQAEGTVFAFSREARRYGFCA